LTSNPQEIDMSRFLVSALLAACGLGTTASMPAQAALVDDLTNLSGLWLDAERPAQGLMLEQIDPPDGAPDGGLPRVVVSWFTWAPAADPDPGPRWLFGIGRRDSDRIQVQLQIAVQGNTPFQDQEAPAQLVDWGSAEIRVLESSAGVPSLGAIDFVGPPGWGQAVRPITQLTTSGAGKSYDVDETESEKFRYQPAGTYSDPTQVGQGWIVNLYGRMSDSADAQAEATRAEAILLWFTYDSAGQPSWLFGLDTNLYEDGPVFAMQRAATGGTFEGGTPQLVAVDDLLLAGAGGPPGIINCGEVSRVVALGESGPDDDTLFAVRRLTQPYAPGPEPETLCFSR
jgi:hypothetical protein